MKKTLARLLWLYPGPRGEPALSSADAMRGTPIKVSAGVPVEILETKKAIGRGRNKITRLFIRTVAPDGWGEFSKRDYYGWADPDDVAESNPRSRRAKKNPRRRPGGRKNPRGRDKSRAQMDEIKRQGLLKDFRKAYAEHAGKRGGVWPFMVYVPFQGFFYLHNDGGVSTDANGKHLIGDLRSAFDERFKKNPRRRFKPAGRGTLKFTAGKREVKFVFVQVRKGAAWISRASAPNTKAGIALAKRFGQKLSDRTGRKVRLFVPSTARYRTRKNPAKKNPVSARDPRVLAAARRFKRFTGHDAESGREVAFPDNPGVGLAVGPVLMIGYETTRDGKREKYAHRFAAHARPLLASSHDGRTLYLLGGAYRFTDRGIVDTR